MAALKSTHSVQIKADVVATVTALTTGTAVDTTFTVPGALPGYSVTCWCEALEAGLILGNAYVSALNTVKVRFANPTAGTITPASHTYRFVIR